MERKDCFITTERNGMGTERQVAWDTNGNFLLTPTVRHCSHAYLTAPLPNCIFTHVPLCSSLFITLHIAH